MKKINSIIFAIILLLCNCDQIKPSSNARDSILAIYNGIPENRVFNKWVLFGPIPVLKNKQSKDDQVIQKEAFEKDPFPLARVSHSIKEKSQLVGNSQYKWQLIQTANGIVDLTQSIGDSAFAIAYAYAQINMTEELEFILGVGSDDAIKVWINKKLVHSNWVARGVFIDNDLVPVKLKKGTNEILIKIQNRGGNWAFGCLPVMPGEYSRKLIFFSQIGLLDNVKQLLKCGADINAISDLGLTPFQTARVYGQKELADFFLESGADSTIQMPSKEIMVDYYLRNITRNDYPGAMVLVSKDGKVLYKKAFGYSNLENEILFNIDTKFRIASVTKQFTATAIMKLQEQGLLDVNDTVSKYIPELKNGNKVTIHHLLTHTSGLQRDWNKDFYERLRPVFKSEDMIQEIKSLNYDFNPGESWSYSNCGYIVLSCIIERVSGLSYSNFLSKNILEPLGMTNTGIHQWNNFLGCDILKNEASGYCYENDKIFKTVVLDNGAGAGALYSTLEDLFKWNEAVFNKRILEKTDLETVLTSVKTNDGSPDKYGLQYGYGWMISKINNVIRVHHGGALDGYDCNLNRFLANNLNVIVFLNRFPFPPGINADIAAQDIARIYLWEEMNK